MDPVNFKLLVGAIIAVAACTAYVASTWMRVRHGYPLESSWGRAMHPQRNTETEERVRLLTQENAQLRAEIGAMKDRLVTVERIVTDGAYRLDREIEGLRGPVN
jgi:hypothetical protein